MKKHQNRAGILNQRRSTSSSFEGTILAQRWDKYFHHARRYIFSTIASQLATKAGHILPMETVRTFNQLHGAIVLTTTLQNKREIR